MATKASAKPPGWGEDDKKKEDAAPPEPLTNEEIAGLRELLGSAPAEPLTENELTGLRAIIDRHGFDSDKGTF